LEPEIIAGTVPASACPDTATRLLVAHPSMLHPMHFAGLGDAPLDEGYVERSLDAALRTLHRVRDT